MTEVPREHQEIAESLERMVRRAQKDGGSAFDALVRRCYADIYRWALVQTGDPDEAEDVTQEVLVRLHRKLRSFKGRSKFSTWLFQITRNVALGLGRTAASHARKLESMHDPTWTSAPGDEIDQLQTQELAALVRAFFRELPERQRQVFDLADLQGFAPTEIGQMLGMNPVTVRANLCKARRTIRGKIVEGFPELVRDRQ